MALRGVLTHRKTRRLAKLLGIDQCGALGVLEALWHVTAENQPDGGIGRMKNSDIADEMFSDRDPDELVSALEKSGWIDILEGCRLFVHDWHEHADDSIRSKLIQWTRLFANGEPPRLTKISRDSRPRIVARYVDRYGEIIRGKMETVRVEDQPAHGGHIQSPEPESRARVQSQSPEPDVLLSSEESEVQKRPALEVVPPPTPTHPETSDEFDLLYRNHPITGHKNAAKTASQKLTPAIRQTAFRAHAEWCQWWRTPEGQGQWKPNVLQFFEDEWYLRKPRDAPTKREKGARKPAENSHVEPPTLDPEEAARLLAEADQLLSQEAQT